MTGLGDIYPDRVTTPGKGSPRWVRAGLLALLTVLVSVGGHALAGGTVQLSLPLLVGGTALGGLCVAAADVRRSFGEIFAVVLMAQPVLHLLASMGGHGHGAVATSVTPGMAATHVGAALAVSFLLADAERACWALAGLFTPVRLPGAVTPRRPAPRLVPACVDAPTALFSVSLASSVSRRGPPLVVGAP